MSAHRVEYPRVMRITYEYSYRRYGKVLDVSNTREFKTAVGATRWYVQQWSNKRHVSIPYNIDDGRIEVLERRVLRIFKKYLL